VSAFRCAGAGLVASIALVVSACGGAAGREAPARSAGAVAAPAASRSALPAPQRFLAVDRRARSVTITLIAAYDGVNGGFNFDGYSRVLAWRIPRGWTVHVVCKNRGPLRHSCAVVPSAGTTKLSFRGASTPQPLLGLEAGHSAEFSFRASRVGHYRLVCLVPGHEEARMWDVLEIVRGGSPAVLDLQAP
jgi:hypothetical protein